MPLLKKITTQPTAVGALIDCCLRFNQQYIPQPYWTVNERYQVHHATAVPSTSTLKYGWFCAGIGGNDFTKSSGGLIARIAVPMSAEDTGIYKPNPFVVRPINADLTQSERAAMGLSGRYKVTGVGNVEYWGYYLKKYIVPNTPPTIKKIVVTDGVQSITDFVANSTNNAPIPPILPVGQANSTNGTYYSPSFIIDLSLSDAEFEEYQAAAEAIYGSRDYGYISEIGMVAGYEASVPVLNASLNPAAGTYTEVLRATITNRLELDIGTSASGFQLTLDSAAAIPQFGITSIENP